MRLASLFRSGLVLAALLLPALASSIDDTEEPAILVTASFAEENPFGHVTNGEKNRIDLIIENNSNRNVSLTRIAGSFHHPETNALIKNTSSLSYGVPLIEGTKIKLPYTFHSEFKPGDLRLYVWLDHAVDGETYRVTAFDSVVAIVEPAMSVFDYKLISTYAIVLAALGGLSYYAYLTFVPQPKKKRASKPAISEPVGPVTATGAGGYQEEWIPAHHLPKTKKAGKKTGAVTSGDETSGAETSGLEKRRRKGRK